MHFTSSELTSGGPGGESAETSCGPPLSARLFASAAPADAAVGAAACGARVRRAVCGGASAHAPPWPAPQPPRRPPPPPATRRTPARPAAASPAAARTRSGPWPGRRVRRPWSRRTGGPTPTRGLCRTPRRTPACSRQRGRESSAEAAGASLARRFRGRREPDFAPLHGAVGHRAARAGLLRRHCADSGRQDEPSGADVRTSVRVRTFFFFYV